MLLDRGDGEHEAAKDVVDVEQSVHSVGRSIGLVGIGLGVLVMLLIIAFITCLRRRKIMQVWTVMGVMCAWAKLIGNAARNP